MSRLLKLSRISMPAFFSTENENLIIHKKLKSDHLCICARECRLTKEVVLLLVVKV